MAVYNHSLLCIFRRAVSKAVSFLLGNLPIKFLCIDNWVWKSSKETFEKSSNIVVDQHLEQLLGVLGWWQVSSQLVKMSWLKEGNNHCFNKRHFASKLCYAIYIYNFKLTGPNCFTGATPVPHACTCLGTHSTMCGEGGRGDIGCKWLIHAVGVKQE